MITSLFSKSKPINFLIVFLITLVVFFTTRITAVLEFLSFATLVKLLLVFGVIYTSILLLNFIVEKNSLTQKNNYEILIFVLFLAALPEALISTNVILANFFILLAFRRIVSLKSQKEVSKKIFDAAFWIAIAALFYFWAITFIILIFIAIFFYTDNNIKNWIIPFVGLALVALFAICYSIIFYDDYFTALDFSFSTSFDYSNFNNIKFIVAITIIFSFGFWAGMFCVLKLKEVIKTLRPSFKLVLIWCLISLILVLISPLKLGSEFLFLFTPLAIVVTNYLEMIKEKWFKEVFLSAIVILPIVILIL